jgi:hypothetical protein
MRTRYEAALKASLKKGEVTVATCCPRRMSHVARHTSHVTRHTSHVTRHTSHVTRHTHQLREDKLPKSLPKKDARAQINDVRSFYQVRFQHHQ